MWGVEVEVVGAGVGGIGFGMMPRRRRGLGLRLGRWRGVFGMGSSRCGWVGWEAVDGLCFGEGRYGSIALFFEALCGMGGRCW